MATEKQKKIAELIVENSVIDEPLNGGEMLEKVGYSPNLVKQPGRVLQSEGVLEHLEVLGFTESNAKMVVTEIMLNGDNDPSARLKATDQVFKVMGAYAPEKSVNLNVNSDVTSSEELEALARRLNETTRDNS